MKFKIISDSSCDLTNDYTAGADVGFQVVPFRINILDKEFVDDDAMNVDAMIEAFEATEEKTSSSCPSPQAYYDAAREAEYSFIVTISSQLSGSYNSACVARDMTEKDGRRLFVIDSKATCGVQVMIIDKLAELIAEGLEYEEICARIERYANERNLLFLLRRFDNLIRNGRILKIVAKFALALNITPICAKTPQGTIDIKEKILGNKKTFKRMVELMGEMAVGRLQEEVVITYCRAEEEAIGLKERILGAFPLVKRVRLMPAKGLAGYYALPGGIIVSF